MRDPEGWVEDDGQQIIRHAYHPLPESHFLRTPSAQALVEKGILTPFSIQSPSRIAADRIDFPTYPREWVPSQLFEAARTTLEVLESAVAAGYEIKDASARNILFRSNKAEFIDHFSFQPIISKEWWAYGQFLRHFIFPLAAYRYRGISPADTYKAHLDGLEPNLAKAILGSKSLFSRVGLAFLRGSGNIHNSSLDATRLQRPDLKRTHHKGLISFLNWQLNGIDPRPAHRRTAWKEYETERDHYPEAAILMKRETVARWLTSISPASVTDFGCNQGEFSLIAAETTRCSVLSVDADIGALEKLRQRVNSTTSISTVLASLDNIDGDQGWSGSEFRGLKSRLESRSQVVMSLALIHHLSIGFGIPIEKVAQFFAECTTEYCIVEFISPLDSQTHLIAQYRRAMPEETFSLDRQRAAFQVHFQLVEEIHLEGTQRTLALLRRNDAG